MLKTFFLLKFRQCNLKQRLPKPCVKHIDSIKLTYLSIRVFFIVLMMLCSTTHLLYAERFCVDGIYYRTINEYERVVEVTYKNSKSCLYEGEITIPSEIIVNNKTYTVVGIGNEAFATDEISSNENYHLNLKKISLPNTIRYIGQKAFYNCYAITNLILPPSVRQIREYAFMNMPNCKFFFLTSPEPPSLSNYVFPRYSGNQYEIIVPQKKSYLSDPDWADQSGIIEIVTLSMDKFQYIGKSHVIPWESNMETFNLKVSVEGNTTEKSAGNWNANIKACCTDNNFGTINYSIDFPYVIEKSQLDITIDNVTREYGDENPIFSYNLSGFVNGEDQSFLMNQPVLTTPAVPTSDSGDYPITATLNDTNYTLTNSTGTLSITKAPLQVCVNNSTKVYGDPNPPFTLSFHGLKCNEYSPKITQDFVILTTANKDSNVGTYDIFVSGGTSPNYIFNYQSGKLEITKADLTIKADNAKKQYYSENPEFSYSLSGIKIPGEKALTTIPTLYCEADKKSPVGTYPIIIEGAASDNYKISYANGNLDIYKRTLTVKADNFTKIYGSENPDFTLTYTGFVNNENETILNTPPSLKCTANVLSDTGDYAITPFGGDADNYTFKYINGYLTITKAEQEIIWNQTFDNYSIGDQIKLEAETTSNLRINYILSDEQIVSLYWVGEKAYLDCLKEGTVTIRATQEGNKNYLSAVRVSKVITVKTASGINNVSSDQNNHDYIIYDTNGQIVTSLVPGRIYIKNGRKFIKK